MTRTSARALAVARPVIQGLTVLNLLYAVSIAVLLVASFFVEGWPQKPLGLDVATMHPQAPAGLRAIMVIGLVVIGIVHTVLRRLLAIVDTVRGGDPFILPNARRLDMIAWSVLTIEVLRLVVIAIAGAVLKSSPLGGFTLAPWLAVLMLFVLSGVFAKGAGMRSDLEGTV
jgi:hypothetical protein